MSHPCDRIGKSIGPGHVSAHEAARATADTKNDRDIPCQHVAQLSQQERGPQLSVQSAQESSVGIIGGVQRFKHLDVQVTLPRAAIRANVQVKRLKSLSLHDPGIFKRQPCRRNTQELPRLHLPAVGLRGIISAKSTGAAGNTQNGL